MTVRQVKFAWNSKRSRYSPTRRLFASFVAPVDDQGRIVEPTPAVPGLVDAGWQVATNAPAHDPAEVRDFLAGGRLRERKRTRW